MKKGLLCILLCLCLTLILIPANLVQAEDPTEEPVEEFGTKDEVFSALGIDADEEGLQEALDDAISPYGEGAMTISAVPELYVTRNTHNSTNRTSGYWRTGERPDFLLGNNDDVSDDYEEYESILGRSLEADTYYSDDMLYAISEELTLLQDAKVNFVAELVLSKIPGNPDSDNAANTVHDAVMTVNLYYLDTGDGLATGGGNRSTLACSDETPVSLTLSVKDENKLPDSRDGDSDLNGWENNGWEYDALMEMVAGDFDGDSMDELAIYDPGDECVRFYDISLNKDADGVPTEFSLTEMNAATISVPQQSYVPRYEYDNEGHVTDDPSMSYQLIYPVVSLTTVDFVQDYKDELAVAVSPNFYRKLVGYGNGSALFVYDMNGDLTAAPTKAYEQRLEWDAEDGYSIGDDETVSMRYVGVADGDIDGDGGTELIAAGYLVSTEWWDGFDNGGDILYTILGYDRTNEKIVNEMSGAAGAVYKSGNFSYLSDELNEGFRYDYPMECNYIPPMAVATAQVNGSNAAAQVFMGDSLYIWDPKADYSDHGVGSMAQNGEATLQGDMSKTKSLFWESTWKCCYVTDIAVGNFNSNVFGYEQLVIGAVHKDGQNAGADSEFWYYSLSCDGVSTDEDRYDSDNYTALTHKYDEATASMRSGSVLAVNFNTDDSTYLKPVNRELRYSKAAVLAVLQAAPYFDDLTVLDPINYQSGGTSFGVSASVGGSAGVGIEASASVGLEFEQGFSVLGFNLFKAGATGTVEIASSQEFIATFETSTGVSYETGSQDSVVVFTIPQFVYNYEMWVPESQVPTDSAAYNNWIAQRVEINLAANYDIDRTDGEGLSDDEISVIRTKLTMEMMEDYPAGTDISAHWEPFSVVAPLDMINTVLTVEAYDEVAESCGLQKVRGRLLNNEVGNPSSYTYRPFFFNPLYTGVAIGEVTVSKDFETSVGTEYSITMTKTASGEGKIGLAGFNLVLGASLGASVSAGVSVSTGMNYSGAVVNMPEGSDNYGFSWTFGYQPYMLNGLPVPVLQYHVINVQEPPSLPVNLQIDGSTDSSITLSWEQGRKIAKTYDIYLYDEVYDRTYHIATVSGDTTSYTHTGLSPSTTYSYRLAAVNDATNSSILSAVVTGRTAPSGADAPYFSLEPEDYSAYPSESVSFTAQAASASPGQMYYQWQRRVGGLWQDIVGARGETFTVVASLENNGANYRCRVYQIIYGSVAEAFSKSAVLSVAKLTPTVDVSEITDGVTNAAVDLQATLSGADGKPAPTGGLTYEVVCLSGNGADATPSATFDADEGHYKAGWTPTQPGLYRVTAAYSGDTRYRTATDSFEIYVTQAGSPVLTLITKDMTYGDTQTFEAKLDGNTVTGVSYTVGNTALTGNEFTPAQAGSYIVKARYKDAENKTYTAQSSFNVAPAILTVTAKDVTTEVGTPAAVEYNAPEGLITGDNIEGAFKVVAVEKYDSSNNPVEVKASTPIGSYPIIVNTTDAADALSDKYTIVLQSATYTVTSTVYRGILTYGKTGNGTISAIPESGDEISNTPVTFTATPTPGNRVASWSVKVGDAAPVVTEGDVRTLTYTLEENANLAVTVNFEEDYYQVSCNFDPNMGSASAAIGTNLVGSEDDVAGGAAVSFTATAKPGYTFLGWKLGNGTGYISTHEIYTHIVKADTVMKAEFIKVEDVIIREVTASAGSNGSISPTGKQSVANGDGLSVTATAKNANYVFVGWTVTGLGDAEYDATANPLVITNITADGTVKANFNAKVKYVVKYDSTVSRASANGTSFDSGAKLDAGAKLLFTADVPEAMYVENWEVNGETKSGENGKTLSLVLAERIDNVEVTFTETAPAEGGGGGASKAENTVIIVDGEEYDIGTETETDDGLTVTADQEQLGEYIDEANMNSSVIFPIEENDSVSASLVVENIEQMAQKGMTLSVTNGDVSYDIPATAIDTQALMAALNASDSAKVPFTVTITELTNSSVSLQNGMLMLDPVSFSVTATYGGKTVEVKVFEKYVQRVIEIPDTVNASLITTAVVIENGKQRHVPTEVLQSNGKWYARINSLTNSTYALINYEASFNDDNGKWYEAVVSEMASRGVINGRSAGFFDGEANITRAEFAAILVRALGLPENGDASAFSDVTRSSWFYGAVGKAYEYGLVGGRGNGSFDPMANITRQEAMAMIHRAAAISEFYGNFGSVAHFSDASSISAWAMSDAQWNVGSGLIQGNSGGMICGQDNISRSETATIILRLLQRSQLVDVRARA